MSKFKRAAAILLCVVLLLGAAVIGRSEFAQILTTAANAEDATNGTCGENLTWSYNTSTQTLTISGTGEMDSFIGSSPWSSYNDSIKTVRITYGIICIGYGAFYDCTGLSFISIPDSVKIIDNEAFFNCDSLTSITIPDSVLSIGVSAFAYSGLKSVTIGNSVTNIGEAAFSGCTSLRDITIPNCVTNIGHDAFSNTYASVFYSGSADTQSIGATVYKYYDKNIAFSDETHIKIVHIKHESTEVTIPDSVTNIGDLAFVDCTELTSITIPDSVTSIGAGAFYLCTGLTSVTIGCGVTSIGSYAFYNCTGLTDVYFRGTEEEWNAITVAAGNDDLLNATIHFLGDAPAHIHSYSAAVTKEASCSAEGVMTYTCACGDSYTAPIEALPHTPKTVTVPATCTENGAEYTICDVCGERLDAGHEIPAAGHSFETGETYERGKRIFTHTCTVCGYVTQSGDNGRRVITLQQFLETLFNRLLAVLFRLPFDGRKR